MCFKELFIFFFYTHDRKNVMTKSAKPSLKDKNVQFPKGSCEILRNVFETITSVLFGYSKDDPPLIFKALVSLGTFL